MPDNCNQIRAWRETKRRIFIEKRRSLSLSEGLRCSARVASILKEQARVFIDRRIGFYWPKKGEINIVPFMRRTLTDFAEAALPVIVQTDAPLEFWHWSGRTELISRGLWHMPSPIDRILVNPEIVLIPLVGFDEQGYRLGYGNGYYDRTLSTLFPRPLAIGIGHEMGRMETIHPQSHDIRLDAIITEYGIRGSLNYRNTKGSKGD